MDNLIVLGVATEHNQYVKNWEKSLKKANINYEILGMGCKWTDIEEMLSRQLLGYKYLIENNIDEETIICHCDVYDCLFQTDSAKSLINLIKKDKLYVSAEFKGAGGVGVPLTDYYKVNKIDPFNPYICGGFVIGSCKNMKHWYNFAITYRYSMPVVRGVEIIDLIKKRQAPRNQRGSWKQFNKKIKFNVKICENDDQALLCQYANYNPDRVIIDTKEEFCITAHCEYQNKKNLMKYDNIKKKYINQYDLTPCVIHVPYLFCPKKMHGVKLTRLEFYNNIFENLKI